MKKLDATPGLKDREKPFEIAASLGRLYVGQGRYAEAKPFYEQALAKADPVRTFFAAKRKAIGAKPLPAPETIGCAQTPDATLDSLFVKAKARPDDAQAAACAKAALTNLPDVDTQWGNLLFVLHDSAGAVNAYTRALETFDTNHDARYGRASVLLDSKGDDLPSLKQAKADLERFIKEAPSSPRVGQAKRLLERTTEAIDKGGISKLPQLVAQTAKADPAPANQVLPPKLSAETIQAFQNAPRTPEMEQNFAKTIEEAEDHLAHGRLNEARSSYIQVMPYQPTNPRLRAGMAWTMIRLNRQPMADNVWRAALENPEAISALGDTLKAKGDAEGARAVWQHLKESMPSYAPQLDGKLAQ